MGSSAEPLRVGVIMAGGSGERFWPLSRLQRPKQILQLSHPDKTMLGEAVDRVKALIPPERIFVVTSRHLVEPIRQGQQDIPPENVLGEPCRRNTSGCLAFAAAHCLARYNVGPESISMAVITADHKIGKLEEFQAAVRAALEAVERHDILGIIGVKPDRPETGYGYLEIDAESKPFPGGDSARAVYPVARFREKPNLQTAIQFLESGHCYWNSGMFFWRVSTFLREAESACPSLAAAVGEMTKAMRAGDQTRVDEIFATLEDVPIDVALVERSKRVAAALGHFEWADVGSWDALHRLRERDADGNVAIGNPVFVDSSDCLVYNEKADEVAVAVIGVQGLAVIVVGDAVLVAPRERSQDIKRAVAELRRRGAKQL